MGQLTDQIFIGIDLGGTNIQAGVVNGRNKLLASAKVKTKGQEGTAAVLRRIRDVALEAVQRAGLKMGDVAGLGIGAPGVCDIKKGLVIVAVNLRWKNFMLADALGDLLRIPVVVDNDVNVAAWGEHQIGAGKGYTDMMAVWVGTGVGGGLILNNQLYYGHMLTAGEIGHMILHADSPLGRRTVENCASRSAVVNHLTQLILTNHPSKISALVKGDLMQIRSKVLAKALSMDDSLTRQVVSRAGYYIGVSIANVVTLLSLPCVVVGGGMTESMGKPWLNWVREGFEEAVFPQESLQCQLIASQLGDDAAVYGAALLARQRLWKTRAK